MRAGLRSARGELEHWRKESHPRRSKHNHDQKVGRRHQDEVYRRIPSDVCHAHPFVRRCVELRLHEEEYENQDV